MALTKGLPGFFFIGFGKRWSWCFLGFLIDRLGRRVHNDLPLSLAHQEALHDGRPTGIVGAGEHGDEGGEAGRHFV